MKSVPFVHWHDINNILIILNELKDKRNKKILSLDQWDKTRHSEKF